MECAFGGMTKKLSGLVLDEHSECLEKVGAKGKSQPSGRIKKTQNMQAMEKVNTHLPDYKYMGHPWKTACVPLDGSDTVTFENQQVHNQKYTDYEELDRFYFLRERFTLGPGCLTVDDATTICLMEKPKDLQRWSVLFQFPF